jgi:hypothetical protein
MANHDWVKSRLDNWARWLTRRDSGALGYPRRSSLCWGLASGSGPDGPVVPVNDIEASRMHDAIESLHLSHSQLYLVVYCRYVGDPRLSQGRRRALSVAETARAMCCAQSTVYSHMTQALNHLSEVCSADTMGRRSFTE